MKRSHEQISDIQNGMGTNGSKMEGVIKTSTPATDVKSQDEQNHVIVVGAGPAGLMLA
jgi:NADPH-dependent 2,4-dienoyl-CoA reductase/sulfur reductase-like enzyme